MAIDSFVLIINNYKKAGQKKIMIMIIISIIIIIVIVIVVVVFITVGILICIVLYALFMLKQSRNYTNYTVLLEYLRFFGKSNELILLA